MVKKDLERVRIKYRTDDGVADFHAAGRHTHITELLRNGASLPEAQRLARHSGIRMTMKYTHIGMADQAAALSNLPGPALHGRCTAGVVGGQLVATGDTIVTVAKSKNPCRSKGLGNSRRRLASDVKFNEVKLLVEDRGVEPTDSRAVITCSSCSCGICSTPCAVRALQDDGSDWLRLSELGTDLQSVLLAWKSISDPVRKAILSLLALEK